MKRKICGFLNKTTVWLLIVMMWSNMLMSCTNDMFGLNKPEKVTLSAQTVQFDSIVDAGGSHMLTAEVKLKSGETTSGIEWYVNDEVISVPGTYSDGFAVDSFSNGTLIYRITKAGVYRVRAEATADRSKFSECVVTIGEPLRELHIQMGTDEETIVDQTIQVNESDGSFTVSAVLVPEDAYQQDVMWSVEDNGVLSITRQTEGSVDTAGNVVRPKATIRINTSGSATLTCRSIDNSEISASVNVVVKPKAGEQTTKATSVTVTDLNGNSSVEVPYNDNTQGVTIRAVVTDGFGNTITRGSITWESDNGEAISVRQRDSRSAIISASQAGTAMIKAVFLDEGEEEPVTGELYAYVSGAIEGISSDSELYRLQTGTTTGNGDIKISYNPSDTVQKGYSAESSDTNVVEVQREYSDYLVLYAKNAGEAEITLTSDYNENITDTFRVIVSDTVSAADRITKLTLSDSHIVIEPPFSAANPYTITATTWVREDASNSAMEGSYSTYGVRFESDDTSVVQVRDYGNGKAGLIPSGSGETVVRAVSLVDEGFYAEAYVTVTGALETIVAAPASVEVTVKQAKTVRLQPVPSDALITITGEEGKTDISATLEEDFATVSLSLLPNNTIEATLQGVIPGYTTLNVYADGKKITSVPVRVVARDENYITEIRYSDTSVIMRQDSDPQIIDIHAYDKDGKRIQIEKSDISYIVMENGRLYDDPSDSRIADIEFLNTGSVSISPRNSGVTILRATVADNSLVSADMRIEVGGSDVQGDSLRRLVPQSNYLQVREGSSVSTGVNFIPADYENQDIEWEVQNDGEENVRLRSAGAYGEASFLGEKVGKDVVIATSSAERGVNTSFTIETVAKSADAYQIVLDRYYLSFDRNQKAIPAITATVYKNGIVTNDSVEWETEDIADVVNVESSGNTATVEMKPGETTGQANVTAKLASNPMVSASCFVEVIDSYAYETEAREIVVETSSMVMDEGRIRNIGYEVIPSYLDERSPVELTFTYSESDIVEAVQDIDNREIEITALKAGTVDVTATVKDTDVSDTFRVRVEVPNERPVGFRISVEEIMTEEGYKAPVVKNVLNLSQEYMDKPGKVTVNVIDGNGKILDRYDNQITFRLAGTAYRQISLNANGNVAEVKPRSVGTAYIIISAPGVEAYRMPVTVAAEEAIYQEATGLVPSTSKVVVAVGGTDAISIMPLPETDERLDVVWSSNNSSVTVEADPDDPYYATVTGVSAGTATVTAKSGSLTATFTVEAADSIEGRITNLSVVPQHIIFDLDAKKLTELNATVFKGGAEDVSETVEWTWDESSLPSNAVTYDTDGNSLRLSKGTAEAKGWVKATSTTDPNFFTNVYVEVIHSSALTRHLGKVVLQAEELLLETGDEYRIVPRTIPQSLTSEAVFSYESSNPTVASVDGYGILTANAGGNAVITVTAEYGGESESAAIDVTVNSGATSLVISDPVITFSSLADLGVNVTAEAFAGDEDVTRNTVFTWEFDDASVASLSSSSSNNSKVTITPKKMNSSTRFTVSAGAISAEGYVVVGDAGDGLIAIVVNPQSVVMSANERAAFEIIPVPEAFDGEISYSFNRSSSIIDYLEENGIHYVTADREGEAELEVKAEASDSTGREYSAEATLGVFVSGTARADSIVLNRSRIDFESMDEPVEVKATIISDTGREFDGEISEWLVENEHVASVTATGNTASVRATGAGNTVLRANYSDLSASIPVTYADKAISTATKPSSIYGLKSSIILNHPDAAAADETKSAELEVGYYPQNLAPQYRGIIWTLDGSSIEITDPEGSTTTDGTLSIRARAKGVTTVTAYSTEDRNVSTSFRVEVLDVDEVLPEGIPELTLDKYTLALEPETSGTISAVLTKEDGTPIFDPEGKLSWENSDDETVTLSRITDMQQRVTAGEWAGSSVITAKYIVIDRDEAAGEEDVYLAASASVEVSDPDLEGQVLRSVDLDRSSLVMVVGSEPMRVRYKATPNIGGLAASWSSTDESIITVAADGGTTALVTPVKAGEADILLHVEQEYNGRTYAADAELHVTVTNGIPESSLYDSLMPSLTDITLSPEDPIITLSYTLTGADGEEAADTPVHEVRVTGANGEVLERWVTGDDGLSLVLDPSVPSRNDMFSFAWYPAEKRMDITPENPGTGFIEAYVYDDPENPGLGGVTARTYIAVTGDLKGLSIPSKYIHLAEGETETVSISYNPVSAIVADTGVLWTLSGDTGTATAKFNAGTGLWDISNACVNAVFENPTSSTVDVRAIKEGNVTLTYTYTKPDSTEYTSVASIRIDNAEALTGGVRKVSFDSSFLEIPYPYEDDLINATVTFADGSTTTSGISYEVVPADGASSGDVDSILTIRTAVGASETGVWLQPEGPGKVLLKATYRDSAGFEHTASIEITVRGSVSALIPSSRNIVLYTGGSTILSVSPDDESAPGLSYRWEIRDEHYSAAGADGTVQDTSPSTSALEIIRDYTEDGSSIILGANDVVTVDGGPSSGYDADLLETYPRRAKVVVTCPEYGIEEEINVTVELLPAENSYPMSLELSSEILSLDGSSDDYQEISATVLDREGNETAATINWYYYPISKSYAWTELEDISGAERWMYKSWLNPDQVADPDFDSANYIYYYMREDASTVFYRPLQAGQYRMKAIVQENPKLQAECTISVGPDVTGISTDAGDRLALTRDSSRTISAVFTPSDAAALARDPVFILQSQKNTLEDASASDAWDDGFVSFTVNGKAINLRADAVTSKSSVLLVEYWDTDTTAALKEATEDGRLSVEEYRTATQGGNLMYTAMLPIDVVPPTATVQTFSINGLSTTIDPSSIESAIVFTVSANATGASSEAFSNWDWVDVDIVGNNTGYVYATTRTTDDDASGTLAGVEKKKIAACDWDKIGQAIAEDGVIYRNGSTFSFVLNPSGIPLEPVLFKAYLNEEMSDGVDADGNVYFDPEDVVYNAGQTLCYIGAKLTSVTQGTTYYNVNNSVTESEGSQVNMILGASATLTVKYNPTQTHQKGVIWYAAGGDTGFTSFEFLPGSDQCSVFARTPTATGGVRLRALSIYDPWFDKMEELYGPEWRQKFISMTPTQHSQDTTGLYGYPDDSEIKLYADYQVVITSPVEKTVFMSRSQKQVNKTDDGSATLAEYAFLPEEEFPPINSDGEVYCYDSTGITDEANRVDAYYIEPTYLPEYGYKIDYEIEEGAMIGAIDMTDIDKESGNFRFVPHGPRIQADGSIAVTYGDVKIRFTAPDINYSETFILHYLPANMKLVKYINRYNEGKGRNSEGSTVPDGWDIGTITTSSSDSTNSTIVNPQLSGEWDVARIAGEDPEIYPLNCLVLYPGEEFDLSVISYTNGNPQYVTDGVTMDREGEDDKVYRHYTVRYGVYSDDSTSSLRPGYISFPEGYLETDFRTETEKDTGLSAWHFHPQQTIKAEKEGVVYLSYTIVPVSGGEYDYDENEWVPSVDPSTGQPVWPSADVASGEVISSGIWVYIVDPVDQMLARVVENNMNGTADGLTTLIPSRISLSQLRGPVINGVQYPSHWYMGERGGTNESITVTRDGIKYSAPLNRGLAYAVFSENGIRVDGVSSVSCRNTFGPQGVIPSGGLHVAFPNPIEISADKLPALNSYSEPLYNSPVITDVGIFGSFGLNRMTGIKAVRISEDGSITNRFLSADGTLDLSELNVLYYEHSGMNGGYWTTSGSLPVYNAKVKRIVPPRNIVDFRIPGNELNLGGSALSWPASAKSSLEVLDIGDNPSQSLTLSGFPALWKVLADGDNSIYSSDAVRYLNIIDTPSLEVLDISDTQFTDVVAEFRDGTGNFHNASWPTFLIARNDDNGAGELDSISVSGGIGFADVGNNAYLRSFILSPYVQAGKNDVYQPASSLGGTWIQYLNLLASIEEDDDDESSIRSVKNSLYLVQTGESIHESSMIMDEVNTDLIVTLKLNNAGYLRSSTYYKNPLLPEVSETIEKGTTSFVLGNVQIPFALDSIDKNVMYQGMMRHSGEIRIGSVSEDSYVDISYNGAKKVTVDDLQGSRYRSGNGWEYVNGVVDVTGSPIIDSISVNENHYGKGTGKVIADASGITSLSDIHAKIDTLSINDSPSLEEIVIQDGDPMDALRVLSANGENSLLSTSGQVKRLIIGSETDIEELSVAGGGAIEEMNIQGKNLRKVDLHDAGLYGKNWTIGSYQFISGEPWNNIDNYEVAPDGEYTKGRNLSQPAISNVTMGVPYPTQYIVSTSDSGTNTYAYRWGVDVTYDRAEDPETLVDWKTWLPGFGNADAELIMYGNTIGFQWITGDSTFTVGKAVDSGMVEGDISFCIPGLYRPNIFYYELKDKTGGRISIPLINGNKNSYNRNLTDEEFNDWRNIAIHLKHYYVYDSDGETLSRRFSRVSTKVTVDNSNEYYYCPEPTTEQQAVLDKYFTKQADLTKYDSIEYDELPYNIGGSKYVYWKDLPFDALVSSSLFGSSGGVAEDAQGHEKDRFSIRMGTLPEELFEEYISTVDPGTEGGIQVLVHNKYKQKGWAFSKESRGYLELESISPYNGAGYRIVGMSGARENGIISDLTLNGSSVTNVIELRIDEDYGYSFFPRGWKNSWKDDGKAPLYITESRNGGEGINPSNLMINYHLYDQNTQAYDHDSITIVYPFGI